MYSGIPIPRTRWKRWLIVIICIAFFIATCWIANSAASPSLSDTAARTQATQRGFQVMSVKALLDQSQEMSVRFGDCAGTLYLGGGHGNELMTTVVNHGFSN